MTREKQIADELKEEMVALRRRMERFEQWKESGYGEPCQEHLWEHEGMHQTADHTPTTYIVRFKCHRCGMTMEQKATVTKETLFDEWQEYRENKGSEEE